MRRHRGPCGAERRGAAPATPSTAARDHRLRQARRRLQGHSGLDRQRQPAEAVAAGRGAGVDLLVGTNIEEGNLYPAPFGNLSTSTAADVDAAAARSHPRPARLVETYQRARPRASAGELRSAMGDALFGAGTRRLADAHADNASAATYRYSFTWRSSALGGRLGATHAVELPFVFDVTGLPSLHGPDAILGPDEPPADLAARMWTAFATTGDPGWDRYDTARLATMHIGDQWTVVDDPHGEELRAWL
jgi:para-nitrobenzyl esterase